MIPLLSEVQLVTALLGQLAGLGFDSGWDDVIRLGYGGPQFDLTLDPKGFTLEGNHGPIDRIHR